MLILSFNIKYPNIQAPTASPNIVIDTTLAENHFKSHINTTCPSIVETKVKPNILSQVYNGYPVRGVLVNITTKNKNTDDAKYVKPVYVRADNLFLIYCPSKKLALMSPADINAKTSPIKAVVLT